MPNAATHCFGAALVVGGFSAYSEHKKGENSAKPLAHSAFAAACRTLPDILEPAFNPNHRQFFHSFGFAGLLGYCLYQLHQKWQPQDDDEKLIKNVALIAGSAYLIHLAMDSTTPKSLPLI
jgi:membrane-bound metal-dependent hydrolase YbcI (DUF457 family)